jgi:hypothetical protein
LFGFIERCPFQDGDWPTPNCDWVSTAEPGAEYRGKAAAPDQPSSPPVILGAMKGLAGGLLLSLVCGIPLLAQEQNGSLQRIRLTLQQPPAGVVVGPVDGAAPKTFGIFTLLPPTGPGEMVRVSVPVGEFVSHAFKGVAAVKGSSRWQ